MYDTTEEIPERFRVDHSTLLCHLTYSIRLVAINEANLIFWWKNELVIANSNKQINN